MGRDKSLVDPLKQEVALYEDILSKLRITAMREDRQVGSGL
jgi:hypothetical protein